MLEVMKESQFDEVFALMRDSFPVDEYRSYEGQKALLENDLYNISVVNGDDGGVIAFVCFWENDKIAFIEHLAVDKSLRSRGLGGRILEELRAIRRDMTICLEVEPPVTEQAIRRINFYTRNGFFLNEYEYRQPALGEGRQSLRLMIMTSGKKVGEDEFADLKRTLYESFYKGLKL